MTAAARTPLRPPRTWLLAWWAAIALVVVCSLLPAFLLPAVPQGGDKLEHFAAYGVLAGAAVQLFATRRALLCAGVGLLGLGVAMEIVQGACTTTRQMDALDALANALGVLAGMASARTPWRDALLRAGRRA